MFGKPPPVANQMASGLGVHVLAARGRLQLAMEPGRGQRLAHDVQRAGSCTKCAGCAHAFEPASARQGEAVDLMCALGGTGGSPGVF
jgi:hypothetical protein